MRRSDMSHSSQRGNCREFYSENGSRPGSDDDQESTVRTQSWRLTLTDMVYTCKQKYNYTPTRGDLRSQNCCPGHFADWLNRDAAPRSDGGCGSARSYTDAPSWAVCNNIL